MVASAPRKGTAGVQQYVINVHPPMTQHELTHLDEHGQAECQCGDSRQASTKGQDSQEPERHEQQHVAERVLHRIAVVRL